MKKLLFFPVLLSLGFGSILGQSADEVELKPQIAKAIDVFAKEGETEALKVPKAIRQFFSRLSKATRKRKDLEASQFLSAQGLFEITKEEGAFKGVDPERVKGIREAMPTAVESMGPSLKMLAYDRFKVLRIEELSAQRRLVYVRLYDNEINVTSPMRWWLVKEENGYRAYDFEDLSIGLRAAKLMTTALVANLGGQSPAWLRPLFEVVVPMQSMDVDDPDSWIRMEEPILKLANMDLPADFRCFASVLKLAVHESKGEIDDSFAELAKMRHEGIDCPIWHYLKGNALLLNENYNEALKEFDSHAKLFGWDSDLFDMVSTCYYQLKDNEKAREAALRGLKDNPRSWACAASLAASSNEEQMRKEIPAIFEEGGDEEGFYEGSLDFLLDIEEAEKAKVLFEVFRQQVTESDLFEYYEEVFAEEED